MSAHSSSPAKALLARLRLRQQDLAARVGLSRPALTGILNHGAWPARADRPAVLARISRELQAAGAGAAEVQRALSAAGMSRAPETERPAGREAIGGPRVPTTPTTGAEEDHDMLLRKQSLSEAARKRFGLAVNPFALDIETDEQLFQTPDVRYVREAIMHAARNAGFIAVIGESGAGKSTIREDLVDRIRRDRREVVVIEPSVLGMVTDARKGAMLRAGDILDAIIWTLTPAERAPQTLQAKARKAQAMLEDSCAAGNKHLLIIEEAHDLALATVKHLKRFSELKTGRARMLGIVLVGQPELLRRLSPHDPAVREVTQRCEIVTLEPMDRHVREYIEHRLARVGKSLRDVMDDAALAALLGRLTLGKPGDPDYRSICYPLAVNNLMTIALNEAASVDLPSINADVMRRAA